MTFATLDAALTLGGAAFMCGAMLISTKRRRRPIKHEGVHGTARFMTESEMKRTGLLPRPGQDSAGVYLGGWLDRHGRVHYLRHDGPEHCIIVGPTRCGKGVSNILPTLLSWADSALVYDEKGELWQLTAGWRSQCAGNRAIRWAPGELEGSAGFNFLEEVRLGTPYEVADAQNIAQMICDPKGEGIESKDHWGKTSFELIAAVILHVLYKAQNSGRTACLADVAFAIGDPDRPSIELWVAAESASARRQSAHSNRGGWTGSTRQTGQRARVRSIERQDISDAGPRSYHRAEHPPL
ncbi:MAG: type IV secretory system conjugative DNA transfer family protein [Acetobacteraceae bacterium]|nr:type IV secretory system conjugative DNA transfer family protein [Acetobacteraceae bacterium]